MISCPLCTKVFKSPSNLNHHMVSHTKEKPDKCHICSAAFGTKYDLKKHIKSVHDGIKQIKNRNSHCSLCSFKCSSKSLLKIHFRIHSAERPFSCSMPSCGFKTKHETCLRRHTLVVHNNDRSYECPSDGCNYRAKVIGNLRSHLKTHSNEKPFACQFPGCNYRGKFNYHLTAHTSRVHSDEKPFKCSTCDYRAKRKSYLMRHLRTHEQVKRFKCQAPDCGFGSHEKDQLKRHFARRHGKKTVLCTAPGCHVKCAAVTLLKEHLKCHESPSDSCRTKIKRPYLHISLCQEGLPCEGKDATKRKHVCKFCLSRFTTFGKLQIHLHRHTKEKPYRCSCCKYTTATSSEVRVHARRNHHIHLVPQRKADKLRKCRTCNMSFWSHSELVLHSMTHLQPVVVLQQLKLQNM